MKSLTEKILGFLLLAGLFSCTSTTQLQVLQPAAIGLPDHINTIATMDRAQPAKGFNNVMEGLISGESIGQDRRGRERALDGLTSALTRTPRFQVKSTGLQQTGSNAGDRFVELLPWEEVEGICRQYGADALLAIELYDSDNFVQTRQQERKRKDKEGNQIIETYFDARMDVTVKIGWRLYDPFNRRIIDEFTGFEETEVNGSGSTEDRARRDLPAREAITQDVSYLAGELYGMRIAPVWITVQREWYQKGKGEAKEDMERAARYAKSGQWEEAAAIWRALVNTPPDPKTGGRAAYNMAVANERAGKLESALDWAQRAYTEFGNNKAQTYTYILRRRIDDQRRVEEQLDN